ncbi:MAG: hypothetical protein ACLFRV_09665 [Acidimicrobiales bacterium]
MTTQTPLRRPSETLDRLLDDELAFSPTFRRRYSTHLAMALAALDQMGAPPSVLQATFDAHARGESEPRDDPERLEERLREVARDGTAATVAARVPNVAVGPASQLFHPMIRLAYALEVEHPGQVAAALLDWETRLQVLPAPPGPHGVRRLRDVAAALADHPEGTWDRTFDVEGTAARPEVQTALEGVAVDADTLDDISSFALAAHATAGEFVTLHLVTGARALRVVSGWVDADTARLLAERALTAMAVGYAVVGAPPMLDPTELDRLRGSALPDRDAVLEHAIGSPDPHVVKLANVAMAEEARTGDLLYRVLAARVVGLVD